MGKLKKLSDQELMAQATGELIKSIINFRDGKTKEFEINNKYADEAKKRGLKVGISENFIHRVFQGEFDNADGVEVSIKEVEGK